MEKQNPECTCGKTMVLVEYKGHYENFKFWECPNCGEPQKLKADTVKYERGPFD